MLQKCSIWKVANVFFKEPTEKHNLKEISKKAGIAHTSVKKHLNSLNQKNIIKITEEKKGERIFPKYHANLESEKYRFYKKLKNIEDLQRSGLVQTLQDQLMPKSIVLFGSYARGEDTENSDIDIYIECREKNIELEKFKKILKREIQLHFKENFKEYPEELKNNIANGIVLKGYLEVFR